VIEEISIRNLGVIGEARLPLGPGFTAITGETGAGKTMVVSALGLLLGQRADSAVIRTGSDQATVEGRWLIDAAGPIADRVRDAGGDLDGSELILGRSVSPEGRSRATVGGRSAPVGVLDEIGHQLVVVHGQSDQIRLRSATAQREALDRFAGSELSAVLDDYQAVYRRWQSNQGELDVLVAEQDRRSREAESLRLAMSEIEAAAPSRDEDHELTERADRLTNLEDLRTAAAQAHEILSSEQLDDGQDVLAQLTSARRLIERVAEHDAALTPITETIAAATFAVNEISIQLASYLASLDSDAGRELEVVQERRAALAALVRKYGPTLGDTIDYLESGSNRLLELDNDSTRIDALRSEVDADRDRVIELAAALTALRERSAELLSEQVTAELAMLAMPNAAVIVEVEDRPDYTLVGKDQVSILLRPHPGTDPRPISKGASGGELSRVMLAIEVVLAGMDPVATFVFDEVDAGVGGASATEVGRRLAALAQSAQVIVVTHLAQVAAYSTNHLVVEKDTDGSITSSSVRLVHAEERTSEMARLLSGNPESETALAHARELLDNAHAG
jgi:DNA repair protein RecN (Recombination protein N)